ncbi:MAG: endonuclease III [Candidatus Bipolaricaulota bacterium]
MQREEMECVRDRLVAALGAPQQQPQDAVETLVLTILSQHTTDANRDRAYASLLRRFGSLDALAGAEESQIADAIRVGGLQRQKAASISRTLNRIRAARGRLDLDFLRLTSVNEALAWLTALPGVGPKTAGIVLLFALGKPYFPIDTHILRVLRRVGWMGRRGDPHRLANAALPQDVSLLAELHLLLIQLGRTTCRPRRPRCGECPIREFCAHGRVERGNLVEEREGGGA